MISGRRRSVVFFVALGICLVALAVTLNIGWILLNWRTGVLAILGVVFFLVIIGGLVLNTTFLVREIRRNEQHDSFINAVTHELKTPVASIRLHLQTLQRRGLDEGQRQEFYRVMLEDSERLLHTIDQVLRAGSTASRFRRALRVPVNLAELAREAVDLARTRFHLPEEALAFEGARGSAFQARVLGDPDELRAAIWNLIDNAIKYSGSRVRVRVTVEQPEPQRIALRVRDEGVGISPAELKRIFRRFYRIPVAVAARVKGSGLGLFIVRSVARRHGGRAYAESEGPGRGSTFTLLLPALPPAAADEAAAGAA
jgi:signal transduction histidine kinase